MDPNNAVVPGARVQAQHVATGTVAETTATDAGIFLFPSLSVGTYTVTASFTGFKQTVQSNVAVLVGSRTTLDLKLAIGEAKESIQVVAEAPLLETTSPQRGTNLTPVMMGNLPIFSGGIRNAGSFVNYMPGVNIGAETSISGSGGRAKEVMIDGGSNTSPESGGMSMQNIGFEAFNEFKLTTGSYSAELGRFGGGVEMYSTKSGTNELHGSGFWGLRRDIFNAAGLVSNSVKGRTPGYRAKERYNELAFTAGGPVYIPKVYDGRNKTFFFFTYSRDMRPQTFSMVNTTVPTAAMKTGNFSALNYAIYDPSTTSGTTRTPFAGNLIPKSQWSKVSQKFVGYIPDPTNSAATSNYTHTNTSKYSNDIWSIKADHNITSSQRVAFFLQRYKDSTDAVETFDSYMGSGLLSENKPDQIRVNHDWILRPTILMHSMFSFSSTRQTWDNPQQYGFASLVGLPTQGGDSDATPTVNLTGTQLTYTSLGATNGGKVANGGQWNRTWHASGYMSWMRGRHEIKMGWDFRRLETVGKDKAGTAGTYSFNSYQTADINNTAKTGDAFASMLLGEANAMSQAALPISDANIRYYYASGFLQDNWRVNSRLTLEFGMRYEVPRGFHYANGNYSMIDLNRSNPKAGNLPGALVFAGDGAGRENKLYMFPTDFSNVGPRFGMAYRIAEKTVFRGGWGIYYQTLGNGGCGCTPGFNYTASVSAGGFNTFANWDNAIPYPAGYKPPPVLDPSYVNGTSSTTMGETFAKAPKVYTWSASLQHEIKGWLLEAGYVGNRGNGLNSTININQLPTSYLSLGSLLTKKITDSAVVAAGYTEPYVGFSTQLGSSATLAQALKRYPQYTTLSLLNAGVGKTWYDSAQFKVERRMGNLLFMGNYTFSKSLSTMHYRQIFGQGGYAQDYYNLADAKSFLPFHQAHVSSFLTSYDLPFGKGKRFFGDSGRAVNAVIGGWTIAGAQKYRSGNLIRLTATSDTLGTAIGAGTTKANLTGSAIQTGINRTDLDYNNASVRWFNSGTNVPFANPTTAFELGTAAFYQPEYRQPPIMTENVSIIKAFSVAERFNFKFRADAFNLFNRTNLQVGTGFTTASTFGMANSVGNGPRIITMGLRLEF